MDISLEDLGLIIKGERRFQCMMTTRIKKKKSFKSQKPGSSLLLVDMRLPRLWLRTDSTT